MRSYLPIFGAIMMLGFSNGASAEEFTREQLVDIIRETLVSQPDILEEALAALEVKRQNDANNKTLAALNKNQNAIQNSDYNIVMGNPNGDVTLVEFFDYNCGYCKRALENVLTLIEEDPNLRVVMKEFPILSQGSAEAAQVAIAVNMQAPEKSGECHGRLMTSTGSIGRVQATELAREMGFDMDQLQRDLGSDYVAKSVEEVYAIARDLGLNGTPSFIVGDHLVPGYVDADAMRELIANARGS